MLTGIRPPPRHTHREPAVRTGELRGVQVSCSIPGLHVLSQLAMLLARRGHLLSSASGVPVLTQPSEILERGFLLIQSTSIFLGVQ